jgi:hypothetical protein
MKYVAIILLFFLNCLNIFSQSNYQLRSAVYGTYVAPNYSQLPPIKPGLTGEIAFGRKYGNESDWAEYYNYPSIYGSIFFGFPGNHELGYFAGIGPQLLLSKNITEKIDFNLKLGVGLAYHTNPYHLVENPVNMLVGSHFTAIANADLCLNYQINAQNSAGFSIGAFHFSNGHVVLPNIGLNMPSIGMFYTRHFDEIKTLNENIKPNSNTDYQFKKFISVSAGVHEYGSSTKPANGPKYLIKSVSFGISKNKNIANKHYFGVNLMHYNSFQKFIIDQELNIGNTFLKSSAANIFWGHEYSFGKFGFYTELGIDIYKPFYRYFVTIYGDKFGAKDIIKSINSNKIGLRYTSNLVENTKLIYGINLKVNMAQADFIEIFCSFEF